MKAYALPVILAAGLLGGCVKSREHMEQMRTLSRVAEECKQGMQWACNDLPAVEQAAGIPVTPPAEPPQQVQTPTPEPSVASPPSPFAWLQEIPILSDEKFVSPENVGLDTEYSLFVSKNIRVLGPAQVVGFFHEEYRFPDKHDRALSSRIVMVFDCVLGTFKLLSWIDYFGRGLSGDVVWSHQYNDPAAFASPGTVAEAELNAACGFLPREKPSRKLPPRKTLPPTKPLPAPVEKV